MHSPHIKIILLLVLSSLITACEMTSPEGKVQEDQKTPSIEDTNSSTDSSGTDTNTDTDSTTGTEDTTLTEASMKAALSELVDQLPDASTNLPYVSQESNFSSVGPFSFNAEGLPNWATIDIRSGQIKGTPGTQDEGVFDITLSLTVGALLAEAQATIKVRHGASYLTTNAIGFYDQKFGGGERLLRNDLTGNLQGEVQFIQSHNVRPNNNFQQDSGDEARSIYSPKLVALREALIFFTPTNTASYSVENIYSIDAEISINGVVKQTLALSHPKDTYDADYQGDAQVVFSNKAWSTTLPWQEVKNGLSIRFIVNKNSSIEKTGTLTSADIDIGEATQVILQSLRLGMLTHASDSSGHYTLNNPILAATDYFQTIPTSRLIVASYADMVLDKVIIRSGVIYDDVSVDVGGYHKGDMRGSVAKSQVSIGINLANFGITSNNMNQRYPHLFKQTTNHHAWGNYDNGRMPHGLSGGNGIGTLVDSRGNEASHEWGHGYGLGHYPGAGLTDDQRFKAHHADSGWGYIAHRNRLRDNLIDNSESTDLQPSTLHLNGRIPYGRDAMSGGSSNTPFSVYTHYTAFSARIIQNHLEQYPLPTTDFASGYKKWSAELGQYQEFTYPENDKRLAAKEIGVAVATILGGYDPDGTNAVIYPVFHGNYGNVFDLPEPDLTLAENGLLVDQCWVTISNDLGAQKNVSVASSRHNGDSINQLHINLNAQFRPTLATLTCRRNGNDLEVTRTVFDGQIPVLPPVAIVGQEAGVNQLKTIEMTQLATVFETQAYTDLVELTSHQQVMLDSYSEADVRAYFSASAFTAYQRYQSTQQTLTHANQLLAKLKSENVSDIEQARILKTLLNDQATLISSIDLPTQGSVIKGAKYFSAPTADNSVTAVDTEAEAALWIMSSKGRIHLAEQPWMCLMPGTGGLIVSECNTNSGNQLWNHTEQSTLKNKSTHKCVDFASHNGSVIMYGCHNNWNQVWSSPTVTDNKLFSLLDSVLLKRLHELFVPQPI